MSTTTEQQLFADQNVLISTARLIVNGVTYPLSNVSSVRLLQKKPNYTFAIILVILGLLLFAGGKATVFMAFICLGIGVALFFMLKSSFIMLIGSAGGEKAALTSKNEVYMSNVVAHINSAIVERG